MSLMNVWKNWASRLSVMTYKEILQFLRDPILMLILVYAFILGVRNAGTSVSMQIEHAPIAFIDNDRSNTSREVIYSFQEPWFSPYGVISGPREGQRLLDSGKVMAVLDIPPQFEESLMRGDPESIQLQLDTSNSSIAEIVEGYASQVMAPLGQTFGLKSLGISSSSSSLPPGIIDAHRIWFNPNVLDSWFQSVCQLIQVITMLALLLPAAAMVREKERGTIEQLTVSPLSPLQIILPKVISMTLAIIIGCCLSLFIVIGPMFHVPMKGSLLLFFVITAIYVFSMTGIGVFIASISRNLAQVGLLSIMLLTPMIYLSGKFTPPEAMPGALLAVMYIQPTYYYLNIVFGILLKGAGVQILWLQILIMIALGSVIFIAAMRRFKRQMG
ncbi:MAG: ABC transporter permease [Armatimonadota bacterium]|nr:ABC transporter permease [bacterium]